MDFKPLWITYVHDLQNRMCTALEDLDGSAKFREDEWIRPEGGGGKTRVIQNGAVFEKGGVNTSVVYGDVSEAMRTQLKLSPSISEDKRAGDKWFACGISVVLHPANPFVPTVHCNYRMFELSDKDGSVIDRWFGGGTDLTPYYLFAEDAKHFHQTYKNVCDAFDDTFYHSFKETCDQYFVNMHRGNERRGIGGIFYDYKRPDENRDTAFWMKLGQACGDAFTEAYIPIVQKRKNMPYTPQNKHWQEIRRGRYVEFNLVHDRGTLFGLKTGGRIESILMSLPPTVRFEYMYQPPASSEEDILLQACLQPVDWV